MNDSLQYTARATDTNTHSCAQRWPPATRWIGLAVTEHVGHSKVINKFDVTAQEDKLHKGRTCGTRLILAAGCCSHWEQVWNKLGHICMHFALSLHLMTPEAFKSIINSKGQNITTPICIQHNIIFYSILWWHGACSRPEQIIYTKLPQWIQSTIPSARSSAGISAHLFSSPCSDSSQSYGCDDGQTNNRVAGAVDLWDFEAFANVPPLI